MYCNNKRRTKAAFSSLIMADLQPRSMRRAGFSFAARFDNLKGLTTMHRDLWLVPLFLSVALISTVIFG